jgi:hypothetical protein
MDCWREEQGYAPRRSGRPDPPDEAALAKQHENRAETSITIAVARIEALERRVDQLERERRAA